jgi:ribokinase
VESLTEAGVLVDCLQFDAAAMTGLMYIVVTPGGERTILGHRGANAATDPSQVCETAIRGAKLFHLSGYALLVEPQRTAALQALEMATRSGLTVTLDPGMSGAGDAVLELRNLLPAVNILLPNLAEAKRLSGMVTPEDCAQALLDAGVQVVALKLGSDGCLVGTCDGLLRVPGFVVEPRDSTGAGDSFAAGLIAGFLRGLDWVAAATLGNALGAMTTSCVGAEATAVSASEVAALLDAHYDTPAHGPFLEAVEQVINFLHRL